jgi:hypothetical protein
MTRRPAIALGPATASVSWEWVGLGAARALGSHFDVELFDTFERVPEAQVVVVVKVRPPEAFVTAAGRARSKLVYAPIDRYVSELEIERDAPFLGACDLVLLHSEVLRPVIERVNHRIGLVEHHSRYALPELVDFKRNGFVLWIGGCEHVPHVVRWLEGRDFGAEVKLLTNYEDRNARIRAHLVAHGLGLRLRFGDGDINGFEARRWSEEQQASLMRECRAAIDIKGGDFNQATKPPTKAQQFIASGIPFGCNPDSSVAHYLRGRGFDVACAADRERLLSFRYWKETRAFAPRLRAWTSPDEVGRVLRRHLAPLMAACSPA